VPAAHRLADAAAKSLAKGAADRIDEDAAAAAAVEADLDQIEALSPERDALWKRLEGVKFLTDDEKRAAIGYGSLSEAPAR